MAQNTFVFSSSNNNSSISRYDGESASASGGAGCHTTEQLEPNSLTFELHVACNFLFSVFFSSFILQSFLFSFHFQSPRVCCPRLHTKFSSFISLIDNTKKIAIFSHVVDFFFFFFAWWPQQNGEQTGCKKWLHWASHEPFFHFDWSAIFVVVVIFDSRRLTGKIRADNASSTEWKVWVC